MSERVSDERLALLAESPQHCTDAEVEAMATELRERREAERKQCYIIYTDHGPSGTCPQCMSVTCNWTHLHVFPNEDAMRAWMEKRGDLRIRGRSRAEVRYLIGDSADGRAEGIKYHSLPAAPEVPSQTSEKKGEVKV
jgi:hypothetical protein